MDNSNPKNLFETRKCLQCGQSIHGRVDKKFCDAYCRNTYNNRNLNAEERHIKKVNSLIRSNRRILKTLSPEGKATVRRDVMVQMGYDFRYFSGIFRSAKGLVYFICYDYAFAAITEGQKEKALIVRRQEYFDQGPFNPWSKY